MNLIFTFNGHPAAANQTFVVGDCEDISTTRFLRKTAFALGRKARFVLARSSVVHGFSGLLGRQVFSVRVSGALHLDIDDTRSLLGWLPLVSAHETLKITAQYFREEKNYDVLVVNSCSNDFFFNINRCVSKLRLG